MHILTSTSVVKQGLIQDFLLGGGNHIVDSIFWVFDSVGREEGKHTISFTST